MDAGKHGRGHLLQFGYEGRPAWTACAGGRLLLIAVLLEGLVGPRLHLFRWLDWPLPAPPWRVAALLIAVLLLVRYFARVRWAAIGLKPWRQWSAAEKSYFFQVLVIANGVFAIFFGSRLRGLATAPAAAAALLLVDFAWGFYQEIVYRGLVQSELVRRLGAPIGIVLANGLFTFGPLHFYHLQAGAAAVPMLAGIFAIGLFFGFLLQRSGNLWMVGTFHGVGAVYVLGAP